MLIKILRNFIIAFSVFACSKPGQSPSVQSIPDPLPSVSTTDSTGFNIKKRITINLSGTTSDQVSRGQTFKSVQLYSNNTTSGNANFTLNQTGFNQNVTSQTGLTTLGTISINQLADSDLVCSVLYHCLVAQIRAYVSGTNPGLYSSVVNQSIPLYVVTPQYSTQTIGFGSAQSVLLETYNIPASTQQLTQANFTTNNGYSIIADFTQAATGVFQAALEIEYVLTGNGSAIGASISQNNSINDGSQITTGSNMVVNSKVSGQSALTQTAANGSIVVVSGVSNK